MYFLKKLQKHLIYSIKCILQPQDRNELSFDFKNLKQSIISICISRFNITKGTVEEQKIQLKDIYTNILTIIKNEITDTLKTNLDKEMNILNIDNKLNNISVIWYYYFEKINMLDDLLTIIYKEGKLILPSLKNYNLEKIYIKSWNVILDNYLDKIKYKISEQIMKDKNDYFSDKFCLKTKNTLDILNTFYYKKYEIVCDYIYNFGYENYIQMFSIPKSVKELIKFLKLVLIKEMKVVTDYQIYENELELDQRLLYSITKFLNLNIKIVSESIFKSLKQKDFEIVYELFEYINTTTYFIDYKEEFISNFVTRYTIYVESKLDSVKSINDTLIQDTLIQDTLIQDTLIQDTLILENIVNRFNNSFIYKDSFRSYLKSYIKNNFNLDYEKEVNSIINKSLQKKDSSVIRYSNLIKFCDNELFEAYFKKSLYKRFLMGRYNLEFEKKFINKVKSIDFYSHKINTMHKDIEESKVLNKDTHLNIVYATKGIWPLSEISTIIPKSFEAIKQQKTQEYKSKYPQRNLIWTTQNINAIITFGRYELQVNGIYVDFLNLFNDSDRVSKQTINYKYYKKDKISKIVKLGLISETSNQYIINENFSYPKKKINLL